MSRFNTFLHRTEERLALPKATRSLILVEVAADLDDLFQYYLQQGLSEEEAAARAEEKVDMSDEALAELVRIHSDARGWTDRMVRVGRNRWGADRDGPDRAFLLRLRGPHGCRREHPALDHLTGFHLADRRNLPRARGVLHLPDDAESGRHEPPAVAPEPGDAAVSRRRESGGRFRRNRNRDVPGADADGGDTEHAGPIFSQALLGATATLAAALLVTLCAGVVWFILGGRGDPF